MTQPNEQNQDPREISPKEFFRGEWFKDGTKQLCADGWPTFVVPVNIMIEKMILDNDQLQHRVAELEAENKRLKVILQKAVSAGEFFCRHADCRKDTWACRCEFCRDNESSKNLREAREALK